MNEQTLSDLQKRRHTRALQIIKRWRLMDDDFMKRCLKNNIPAVECILRIIMEQPDLHVLSVTIEDTIPSLLGHGIRMDVHAVDSAELNTTLRCSVQTKEPAPEELVSTAVFWI